MSVKNYKFIDKLKLTAKYLDRFVTVVFSSNKFTWLILFLFLLQGLWVALSYSYSPVDETFHIGIVQTYTNHLWPVVYDQPLSYDVYRDFAGEGSRLYHFLLSFPLRLIQMFTVDVILQVKLLRIINVILMTAGFWMFVRLLTKLKVSRAIVNVGLVIIASLPISSWIAGSVNYDNLIMLLTPIFLYRAVIYYQSKEGDYLNFSWMLLLGLWASLVKFTFLPIFVGVILWLVWAKRKEKLGRKFFGVDSNYRKLLPGVVVTLLLLLPTLFLFSQTYGVNVLSYGTPRPDCRQTLGIERCISNSIISYNEFQESTVDERDVGSPGEYFFRWLRLTFYTSSAIGNSEVPFNDPMPIYYTSLVFIMLLLTVVGLVNWQKGGLSVELKVLGVVSLIYLGIVFLQGLQMYYKYHAVRAVTWRYILPILPILLTIILSKFRYSNLVKKIPVSLYAAIGLFILSQGGGVISHIVMSDETWYWEDSSIIEFNNRLSDSIEPMIIKQLDD